MNVWKLSEDTTSFLVCEKKNAKTCANIIWGKDQIACMQAKSWNFRLPLNLFFFNHFQEKKFIKITFEIISNL